MMISVKLENVILGSVAEHVVSSAFHKQADIATSNVSETLTHPSYGPLFKIVIHHISLYLNL